MKKFLLAANWKMNAAPKGFDAKDSPYRPQKNIDVIVFPNVLDLEKCLSAGLIIGAQYGRPEEKGAFTGDSSMNMLAGMGCKYVLCGHSERRKYHGETDAMIAAQAKAALAAGLTPVVCVGETLEERSEGKEKDVIRRQLIQLPNDISIIAYEPVWAVGTGKNATPQQAQEMHAFIRSLLPKKDARILYGGSVTPENAESLFTQADVNGFLVGGCSLKPDDFGKLAPKGQ